MTTITDTVQAALALRVALDDYNQTSNDDQILQELNINCSSGDCSWPRISTLGFCSDCTNVTTSISKSCLDDNTGFLRDSCNYTLPNGLIVGQDFGTGFNITSSDCNGSNPTSYYQHWGDTLITSLSILDLDLENGNILALECMP